jgi:hypothetical protein
VTECDLFADGFGDAQPGKSWYAGSLPYPSKPPIFLSICTYFLSISGQKLTEINLLVLV